MNFDRGDDTDRAIATMSFYPKLFYYCLDYIIPLLLLPLVFSFNAPFYTLLRAIYNFEPYGRLFSWMILLMSGTFTWFAGNLGISTIGLCILIVGYSISCLYVWTLFLIPFYGRLRVSQLRAGISFETALRMYNSLRIMTVIQAALTRDFLNPCLHHAHAVLFSTLALFYLIVEFMRKKRPDLFLVAVCVVILGFCVFIEFYAICLIARIARGAKLFIARMTRDSGRNRYKRKVVGALLPNTVKLELLVSLDSIRNGVEMRYFLRYVSRVTENTLTLILASK